jgi:hypothetical protein
MAFLDVAEASSMEETARRNHANAQRACDMVVRLLRHLDPTAEERQMLDRKLSAVRARLRAVGQQS